KVSQSDEWFRIGIRGSIKGSYNGRSHHDQVFVDACPVTFRLRLGSAVLQKRRGLSDMTRGYAWYKHCRSCTGSSYFPPDLDSHPGSLDFKFCDPILTSRLDQLFDLFDIHRRLRFS